MKSRVLFGVLTAAVVLVTTLSIRPDAASASAKRYTKTGTCQLPGQGKPPRYRATVVYSVDKAGSTTSLHRMSVQHISGYRTTRPVFYLRRTTNPEETNFWKVVSLTGQSFKVSHSYDFKDTFSRTRKHPPTAQVIVGQLPMRCTINFRLAPK